MIVIPFKNIPSLFLSAVGDPHWMLLLLKLDILLVLITLFLSCPIWVL
jgi:hypothetical protein